MTNMTESTTSSYGLGDQPQLGDGIEWPDDMIVARCGCGCGITAGETRAEGWPVECPRCGLLISEP